MCSPPPTVLQLELSTLDRDGFAFIPGARTSALLAGFGALTDWADFADSWNDLHLDSYMADGGRYRRRRHAVFRLERDGKPVRQPHQPHWQDRDYNPLNGGIARWFEPVTAAIGASDSLATILRCGHDWFGRLRPDVPSWKVEVHQFRIEAAGDRPGQPTPEGMHRDGVDYVMVLMIRRQNIARGTTSIHDLSGHGLGCFTLAQPFDAALVDDARVMHGVTAVEALDVAAPAFRDVLVVTFKGQGVADAIA
jgi:hypothetical protein